MKTFLIRSALSAFLVVTAGLVPARAGLFITTDTTINFAEPTFAVLGYASLADRDSMTNPSSPTVDLVSGGSVAVRVLAYNNSVLNMNGGTVGVFVNMYNNSTINFNSGAVFGGVEVANSSVLNFIGGSVNSDVIAAGGTANITGGSIGGNLGVEGGVINLRGGSLTGNMSGTGGTLNIYGTDLSLVFFSDRPDYYIFNGVLQDGTVLVDKRIELIGGPDAITINLIPTAVVPEPSTLFLAGTGVVGLFGYAARHRRRAS